MPRTNHVHRQFGRKPAVAAALFCVLSLLSLSCAKIGDPQPPIVRVLRPATDLQARQSGQRVLLVFTVPGEYTTGSTADKAETAEVLRVTDPDRKAGPALPQDSFVEKAAVVATVSPESVAAAKDRKLVVEDTLDFPDASAAYASGFRYAVRFLNQKNETAGISNQVFIAPVPLPAAPDSLHADLGQERIRLTWNVPSQNVDGSRPATVEGYNVYRADAADAFGGAPLNPKPLPGPEFEDRNFEFDRTYYYKVSVVGRSEPYAETSPSSALEVLTRDTFPPGPPANLNAIVESGVVFLLWSAPPQKDVAGYRVYRSSQGGQGQLLETELVRELSYRDTKAAPAHTYAYSVRAVDTHGNEGLPAETSIGLP